MKKLALAALISLSSASAYACPNQEHDRAPGDNATAQAPDKAKPTKTTTAKKSTPTKSKSTKTTKTTVATK